MATELKDYIRCYDEVVDKEFCRDVITRFESDAEYQERIDREKRPSFTELNISKRFLAEDKNWIDIQQKIKSLFVDYVQLYMSDLDVSVDFPARYAFEEFRIKKYNTSADEFKDHVDVGDHASARRFLVCFLYLNTVENGGSTDFPKLDYSIQPQCGRILMFPSTWMYRHAGRPVELGKKYIAGSYLHYL